LVKNKNSPLNNSQVAFSPQTIPTQCALVYLKNAKKKQDFRKYPKPCFLKNYFVGFKQ